MLIRHRYVTLAVLLIVGFTLACNGVVVWLDSQARGAQCEAFKHLALGRDHYSLKHPIPGTPEQKAARRLFNQKDIGRVQAQACD